VKVAYIMSRFPKLTETFVLYEILELERRGCQVEVFPLRRERASVIHAEAERVVRRARFTPWFSWPILCAQFFFLCRKPWAYFAALGTVLWANLGSLRYFAGAVLYFPKAVYFARAMSAQGVSHVHAHFCSHPAAAAYVVNRLTGIPFSFTAHGTDLHCDRHMLLEKVAAAAFVVAISRYNRELILEECGRQFADKVAVIHCGVDTGRFHPRRSPTPHERGSGPLSILCIGTLHEVKGQTHLIDACQHLLQRGVDFQCRFVGDGPDGPQLEEQAARLGLAARVMFLGRRTSHEVAALLQEADVLVAPSVFTASGQREGIPVVLMEAMASGVPVVASRISGIPELVEDQVSGLLATPANAEDIATALNKLYIEPALRRKLGAAGREKIMREFNLSANAEELARRFADGVEVS
jgi:glycosyltransferase involved in cell wall biosynthesis